eukprot:EG_transcript_3928
MNFVNDTVTGAFNKVLHFAEAFVDDKKEECSHPYCTRALTAFGAAAKLQCAHCHSSVCPDHYSPHQLKLDDQTAAFVFPDADPAEHPATFYAHVCEQCFQYYQTVSRLRYLAFMEGRALPVDLLPEQRGGPPPHAADSPNSPTSSASSSSASRSPPPPSKVVGIFPLPEDPAATTNTAQTYSIIPTDRPLSVPYGGSRPKPGKHLIILAHGVFGADTDWENWVLLWSREVMRRNGLAPVHDKQKRLARPTCIRPESTSSSDSVSNDGDLATTSTTVPSRRWRYRHRSFFTRRVADNPLTSPSFRRQGTSQWARALDCEFCVVDLAGHTLKGISYMATHACLQVEDFLQSRSGDFDSFSIIGHSFGGVYSKYMLTLRYQYPAFSLLQPRNFIALATPHLGSRRPRTWFHAQLVTKWFFSDTGMELLMEDPQRLLPNVTHASIPELRAFPNLMTYANTMLDFIVPYGTSIIQVGQGMKTELCATEDETVVAVHRHGVCACFIDDGTATPSPSMYEPPPEFRSVQDQDGETIPTIVQREYPPTDPRQTVVSLSEEDVAVTHTTKPQNMEVYVQDVKYGSASSLPSVPPTRSRPKVLGRHPDPQLPTETATFQAEYIRIMYEELDSLPWLRVDVSIPNLKSHELIILKSSRSKPLRKVLYHVMDHFVF